MFDMGNERMLQLLQKRQGNAKETISSEPDAF